MLEDTIDASGHWRTLSVDTTHYGPRTETKRTQILINPALYGGAPAAVQTPPPKWRAWHCTQIRLAPPGICVQIRDRSGKRIVSWAFGGPQKPPFSVKSWRFSYESDAQHCERVLADVAALRESLGRPVHLEPTGKALRYGCSYDAFRKAGWTDADLIQHGYYRLAESQGANTGRLVEATEKDFDNALRKTVRENMSWILAELKAMRSGEPAKPPGVPEPFVQQLDWMALRWRQTTMPGVDLPKNIKVEVIVEPPPSPIVRWRFINADEARAHDAKRAQP